MLKAHLRPLRYLHPLSQPIESPTILRIIQNTNTGSSTEDSSSSSGKMFGPLTEADFIALIVSVVGVIIAAVTLYYGIRAFYHS